MRFYAKTIASLFVLPLLVAAGCGDDTNNNNTTSSSGGNGSLTLDQFADKLVGALCASAVDCHRAETEAECLAASRADIPEQYIEGGTVKFVPEKADACLAEIAAIDTCSLGAVFGAAGGPGAACAAAFEGTVADGGACFDSEQCVSGFCEPTDPMCSDACCAGTCAPSALPKVGEPCPDGRCEAGAYCQGAFMGSPTTCAAQAAEGQSCSDLFGCKAPALCEIDFLTGMGTCKKPAGSGETCNPQGFFACDRLDERCDPMTTKCTLKGLVGADCSDNGDCVDYAHCDTATMKCAKDLAEGAACAGMVECQGDLSCDDMTMKCGFEAPIVCK